MMKDLVSPQRIFLTEQNLGGQSVQILSAGGETNRKRKKSKSNKRNSFIQKLTKRKETELSEETATSIGTDLDDIL
jgi:hypothetical protein